MNHAHTFRRMTGGRALWLGLLLGLLPMVSNQTEASEREHYIHSVIAMLRLQVDTIRDLATQDFKYSRNLARHAMLLHNTFGLLGPMDWHAVEATFLQKKKADGTTIQASTFEEMADQCQKSMKTLLQLSVQHVEKGGKPEPVLKALDDLQGRCDNCHALLNGTAPDVWGHLGK